jgi:hypothetical protein
MQYCPFITQRGNIMALSNPLNSNPTNPNLPNSNLPLNDQLTAAHFFPKYQNDAEDVISSATSWSAIFAGAVAALVLTMILLLLGAGVGLSSISPWSQEGISAATFGVSTIVWLIITQMLASGMGGYLAGRLRCKWAGTQLDEVYFRDTAHGFLAWSVATLAAAFMISSAIGSIVGGSVRSVSTITGAAVLGGVTAAGNEMNQADNTGTSSTMRDVINSLFRTDAQIAAGNNGEANNASANVNQVASTTPEVMRILMNSLSMKTLPTSDLTYISQLVAKQTGLTQAEAESRVSVLYTNMQKNKQAAESATKEAIDQARKVSFYSTLWLFAALLIGAFSASLAATWGGRSRDA